MDYSGYILEKPYQSEEWLAGKVRVWGRFGWLSRLLSNLPWLTRLLPPQWSYPLRMQEQLERRLIPVKFAERLEHDQLLYPCCRQIEHMRARAYKSDPRLSEPDIWVATCQCKRNHIRVRADKVVYGGAPPNTEDQLANATSIFDQPYDSAPEGDL